MLARYEGSYAASTVVVLGDRSGFAWEQRPVHNYIDALVDAKLQKVKVQASPVCDEFDRCGFECGRKKLGKTPPFSSSLRTFRRQWRPTSSSRFSARFRATRSSSETSTPTSAALRVTLSTQPPSAVVIS